MSRVAEYYRGVSWRRIAGRVWSEIWDDDVFGRAAQLSYFLFFSLFPILLIVSVILGYIAEGSEIKEALIRYFRILPGSGSHLIRQTLDGLLQHGSGGKLSIGIITTLWAASSGMRLDYCRPQQRL